MSRNVVITGSSKGIGFAIAKAFSLNGDSVLLTSRSKDDLSAAQAIILKEVEDAKVQHVAADITTQHGIDTLSDYIKKDFNGCDILINNAGSFIPGSVHNETDGNLEHMLQTNLIGSYKITRSIVQTMIKNRKGDIVNICSIASNTAYANGGSYSISKFAMLGFSRNLREELKPYGIRVISVLPGAVYTDSWKNSEIEEERFMPPEDIASLIVNACNLSRRSVVEEIIVRPQLGDL